MSNILEAKFVDMSDEELLKTVGYYHDTIKRLAEAEKVDEQLLELKQAVKDYRNEHYNFDKKRYGSLLKAARTQMRARGLSYNVSEDVK